MAHATVVYYTSSRENKKLEGNVQKEIDRGKGDLPLISVSQEPLRFGTNICVGDVGASCQNAYRQLLLGVRAAQTRFVCTAESDCIYPPEYFQFVPPDDECAWLAEPLWLLFCLRGKQRVYVLKPRGSESSMVINREVLIDRLETILKDMDYWGPARVNGTTWPYLLDKKAIVSRRFSASVLTLKTEQQMHRKTAFELETRTRHKEPWGAATDVIAKFL